MFTNDTAKIIVRFPIDAVSSIVMDYYRTRNPTIELHYRECGRPDVYDKSNCIARFSNCEFSRGWMKDVVTSYPSSIERLYMWIEMKTNDWWIKVDYE